MKRTFDIAKKEWSFYAFIVFSPVTWLLYTALFGLPENFFWIVPHTVSFLCSALFFVVIIHTIRGKFLNNMGVTKFSLAVQIFKHSIKTVFCMFPIQILLAVIMSLFVAESPDLENISASQNSIMAFILPVSFIVSTWMVAGYSYVIFTGSCKRSIRNSFVVLKSKFKPICLLLLVGFACSGFAYVRQSIMNDSGVLWSLIDIAPLYLVQALLVLGLSYIAISLSDIELNM